MGRKILIKKSTGGGEIHRVIKVVIYRVIKLVEQEIHMAIKNFIW